MYKNFRIPFQASVTVIVVVFPTTRCVSLAAREPQQRNTYINILYMPGIPKTLALILFVIPPTKNYSDLALNNGKCVTKHKGSQLQLFLFLFF